MTCQPEQTQRLSHTVLDLPKGTLDHFNIKLETVHGDGVTVSYNGIPANLPKDYNNTIALWSSSFPNLSVEPLKVVEISDNDQPGSDFVSYGIVATDYCLTYQVGQNPTTMCALAQIEAGKISAAPPLYVDIRIEQITSNSICMHYKTLPGYLPSVYQNWIALWQGFAIPYNSSDPLGSASISSNSSEDDVTITNVSLSEQFTYTLVYFTGPQKSNAAVLIYFKTSGSS